MSDIVKLDDVKDIAIELKKFVVNQGLYTNIKGKNFVHVEGWQFAGAAMGIRAIVRKVTDLNPLAETDEVKYRAEVELYQGEHLVGAGVGFCSNREHKKKDFDEYAIIAMAQTRAISRAYRNSVGWIMKLAGYEATPFEEAGNNVGADDQTKQDIVNAHKAKNDNPA